MARQPLMVRVSDGRGRPLPPYGLRRWLRRVAPPGLHGVVSIALVTDARIRSLNRRFRGKDRVTDVLSFPAGPRIGKELPDGIRLFLGDIVIAEAVARRQAEAEGHDLSTELRVLALHGLLHLLGYDHEHDDGRMRRLEARLLRKGRIRQGLIERAQ
ncbi:MAG TPA: rRNA maturation RNase YbeY [Vicinamibacterales bacterium]|nr:rRNA maturation RNase YbeY [Vicinamibacterales bacterium]